MTVVGKQKAQRNMAWTMEGIPREVREVLVFWIPLGCSPGGALWRIYQAEEICSFFKTGTIIIEKESS